MNKKAIVNFLQNLTLLGLTVTAIVLLMRFPMLDGVVSWKMSELLSAPESTVQSSVDLSGVVASVHLVVTDETEFGRYTQINAPTTGAEFQRLEPLLRGAIGSATASREATHAEFQTAMKTPGIYVDLTTVLPVSVVAAWLGERFDSEDNVRALALTTARETATLFLLREDGSLVRCECALTSSAVREAVSEFQPNGGQFAYETEYTGLAPYTVFVQKVDSVVQLGGAIPAGYSAYNLLTALDLNAHTNSRYFESSGTEVVMQAPHFLWIGTDGSVHYSSDGEVSDPLYQIACVNVRPDAVEVLRGVYQLATTLSSGTAAAPLSLEYMEKTDAGWIITFGYRYDGICVRLGDERAALRVVVTGDIITEFDYYCRAYTPAQEEVVLLPASMAVAIASANNGGELTLAYVDNGVNVHGAHWLVQ